MSSVFAPGYVKSIEGGVVEIEPGNWAFVTTSHGETFTWPFVKTYTVPPTGVHDGLWCPETGPARLVFRNGFSADAVIMQQDPLGDEDALVIVGEVNPRARSL